MGWIVFECPNTGRVVSTGVEHDAETWPVASPPQSGTRDCPYCGRMHEWSKERGAWVTEDPSAYGG